MSPLAPPAPPEPGRLRRIGWQVPAELDDVMIAAVVEHFYDAARRDPLIGPIFARAIAPDRWPAHLATIADFWSSLLLGSGRYNGRPLPKHLALPELEDAHFRRWLRLFRHSAEALCPPEIAALFVERAERIGNSFRMNIAMRRGKDITRLGPLPREDTPADPPPDRR